MIYLDNAATTKTREEVVESMIPYFNEKWHNPSSLYSPSVKIKKDIEKARENVGNFIGANKNEIYFCSCGSEANCMVLQGFVKQCHFDNIRPIIITSTIEHKSILDCANDLKDLKYADIYFVGVDNKGLIDLNELEYLLKKASKKGKILVSLQFANNEIGSCQIIKTISDLIHKYDGIFHTDAVQCVGQIPINVNELGIDALSMSGHKIKAPKGIGFLYKKNGISIKPLIYGSQEQGLRGGTTNTYGIVGLSKAIEYCDVSCEHIEEVINKRNYFVNLLETKFGCKLNGHNEYRLPNNINVVFPQDITGESLLYTLDLSGIEIATGSACNSQSIKPSHVLKAIGLTDEEAMKTVRFTLSDDVTYEDIDYVIDEIDKAIKVIYSLKGSEN